MSKKNHKKVTNLKFDKIMDSIPKQESQSIIFKVNDEDVEIKVWPTISLKKRAQLITDIADSVFVNGIYAPSMFDFAYGYFLIKYFTDLYLPDDPERVYALLQQTDIEEKIREKILLIDIHSEANELIEYRKKVFLKNTRIDSFVDSLTSYISSLNQAAEKQVNDLNISEIVQVVNGLQNVNEKNLTEAVLSHQDLKR